MCRPFWPSTTPTSPAPPRVPTQDRDQRRTGPAGAATGTTAPRWPGGRSSRLANLLRSDDTDARRGYGQPKPQACVICVQRRSRADRSPAWTGIDSTDSSAGRPPLTGLQRINIRWKAQGLRFRDQRRCSRATDSRQMVAIDRWFFSVRYPEGNSAGVRAAETTPFCRAPNPITICEAIPPLRISKVAQNSANPDRLSWPLTVS